MLMQKFYAQRQSGKVQLVTACCYKSNPLLREDRYKRFVLEGLSYMVDQQWIWLYGYVLMDEEFHAMWQQRPPWDEKNVRQPLLRHVARLIKYDLRARDAAELERYRSHLADREYQFWEKQKMRVEITNMHTAGEMLENMHQAPVLSGLCRDRAAYPYSSNWYYSDGDRPTDVPVPTITDFTTGFEGRRRSDQDMICRRVPGSALVTCPAHYWNRFTRGKRR